ncbi:MAG: T9SS type A sorting domain-containing protein [Candidatus Sabulitectum sp.]|nr:T9SS type A sorting domain-containing protein [Candidatus Sabulitectum sp.]
MRAIASDPNNIDRVYAIGYEGTTRKFYKTEDGGSTWADMNANGFVGIPSDLIFHPTDPSRLAAASSSGLYATTDGGNTWSKVTNSFSSCYTIYQSDLMNGLVACTNSGLWIWEEWTGAPVYFGEDPGTQVVKCALETAEDFILAGTTGRSVWRSYCGLSVEESENMETGRFALTVSPNPVARGIAAAVSFSMPVSGSARMIIFDIAGRAVSTAETEELNTGINEFSLNTEYLSSGMYIAIVKSGESIDSARFIVTD